MQEGGEEKAQVMGENGGRRGEVQGNEKGVQQNV